MQSLHSLVTGRLSKAVVAAAWLGLMAGPAPAQAPAALPPAAVASSPAATVVEPGEPVVQYTVIEDDGARIDELKVRGQTQRIVVTPKAGGKSIRPYEIISPSGSHDLQEAPNGVRGAAGKRVWHVLSF